MKDERRVNLLYSLEPLETLVSLNSLVSFILHHFSFSPYFFTIFFTNVLAPQLARNMYRPLVKLSIAVISTRGVAEVSNVCP